MKGEGTDVIEKFAKYTLYVGVLVLLTGLAQAQTGTVIRCSSDDMHRNYCNIGPNNGVQLLRQVSEARCIQGQTWGYTRNQIWVDRGCRADFQIIAASGGYGQGGYGQGTGALVQCSSDDMHRHYCTIPRGSSVRVARQLSQAQCVEGTTFGVANDQLWVDRGCRAEFEVIQGAWRDGRRDRDDDDDRDRDRDRDRDGGYNSGSNIIRCSSDDRGYHTCNMGRHGDVRMARQLSQSPCTEGQTWGVRGNQIWVNRGCRAEFEVTYRGRH